MREKGLQPQEKPVCEHCSHTGNSVPERAKSLSTHARLLDVARTHLHRAGRANVSLREIAHDADISPAAVYRHFKNKDALVQHITMEAVSRFEQSLWRAIAPIPVGSLKRLAKLGEEYIRFAQAYPGDFEVLFSPSASGPRKLDEIPGRAGFGLLLQCVGEAMEMGVLRRADPALVSLLLWARVHGIVHLLRAVDFAGEVELAGGDDGMTNVFNATSAMIFAGLSTSGAD